MMKIAIAHDFSCPYCWVGWLQSQKLSQEFGAEIEWLGYELWPELLEWPTPNPKITPANKPETSTKLSLLLAADQIKIPDIQRPNRMRTFNAHQAVEYAKTVGQQAAMIEALYRAYWCEARDINNIETIIELSEPFISDLKALRVAMIENRFDDQVVDFDAPAYESGIYNVPTFFIGDERLAEQPYSVLRDAFLRQNNEAELTPIYRGVTFPGPNKESKKPYVFINMVSTIDGKIITGDRDEHVADLGSDIDHFLMHRLEEKADAVLVGAGSLRASGVHWNPKTHFRFVITQSGNVDCKSAFLSNGAPYIITSDQNKTDFLPHVHVIRIPQHEFCAQAILRHLFALGVKNLNLLGGSIINSMFIREEMVDEIFLTIAPKLKLGEKTPTIADGESLSRNEVKKMQLVEHHRVGDELFLRYRRSELH
jgi:riboflavin biosynthesis pyrimidine reductase/predicted DsbA family dithiol-disulfide isomerase